MVLKNSPNEAFELLKNTIHLNCACVDKSLGIIKVMCVNAGQQEKGRVDIISHTEAVRGCGRAKERYGLNRATVQAAVHNNWNVI